MIPLNDKVRHKFSYSLLFVPESVISDIQGNSINLRWQTLSKKESRQEQAGSWGGGSPQGGAQPLTVQCQRAPKTYTQMAWTGQGVFRNIHVYTCNNNSLFLKAMNPKAFKEVWEDLKAEKGRGNVAIKL